VGLKDFPASVLWKRVLFSTENTRNTEAGEALPVREKQSLLRSLGEKILDFIKTDAAIFPSTADKQ